MLTSTHSSRSSGVLKTKIKKKHVSVKCFDKRTLIPTQTPIRYCIPFIEKSNTLRPELKELATLFQLLWC